MSIYDNVKTAAELVREARLHGFSTATEDICRAQDIIGHSCEEQLVNLVEDSDKRSTFYLILKNIWDTERVFQFWNQHNNPEHIELEAARKSIKNLTRDLNSYKDSFQDMKNQRTEAVNAYGEELQKRLKLEDEAKERELEIIRLKAQLFDLMTASK